MSPQYAPAFLLLFPIITQAIPVYLHFSGTIQFIYEWGDTHEIEAKKTGLKVGSEVEYDFVIDADLPGSYISDDGTQYDCLSFTRFGYTTDFFYADALNRNLYSHPAYSSPWNPGSVSDAQYIQSMRGADPNTMDFAHSWIQAGTWADFVGASLPGFNIINGLPTIGLYAAIEERSATSGPYRNHEVFIRSNASLVQISFEEPDYLIESIPESGSLPLTGFGLAGLGLAFYRRKKVSRALRTPHKTP